MSRIKIFWLALVTILTSGCIYSLNPLYTAKDVVFNPILIGEWVEKENAESTLKFEQLEQDGYLVSMAYEREQKILIAHLVQVGDSLFLDFFPRVEEAQKDFFFARMIPVHGFVKFEISDDSIVLTAFDYDWLEEMKKGNKIDLPFWEEDEAVITASTEDIQNFIIKRVLKDNKAFGRPMEYQRMAEKIPGHGN